MKNSPKIKILHIIPTLDMGGAERLLVDIVKRLDKTVFTVSVVCFKRGGMWEEEIKAAGANLIVLKKRSKLDLRNLWQLWKVIRSERPALVHTHLGGDLYGRFLAGLLGIPVVSTEHNLNKDEARLTTFAKFLTAPFASAIIAVSKAVAKDASKRYAIGEKKITIIHNGIDLSRFSFSTPRFSKPLRIGSVGRLSKQKDFLILIKAISLLKDFEVKCEIIGEGQLHNQLQQEIKNQDLEQIVTLPGTRPDIPAFLKTLDVFVLPSLWEGLGIVVLEAAATGVPVIASRVDGLTEIIKDDVDGLLFTPGDSEELAVQLRKVFEDPASALARSERLARKVKEHFTIEQMVNQYEVVYKKALRINDYAK